MALTGLAIAAAVGLAKSELVDQPAAAKARQLAAATQAYSPWTGMGNSPQAQAPANPNAFGSMLQYGVTGAMIGSGVKAQNANPSQALGTGAPAAVVNTAPSINPYTPSEVAAVQGGGISPGSASDGSGYGVPSVGAMQQQSPQAWTGTASMQPQNPYIDPYGNTYLWKTATQADGN